VGSSNKGDIRRCPASKPPNPYTIRIPGKNQSDSRGLGILQSTNIYVNLISNNIHSLATDYTTFRQAQDFFEKAKIPFHKFSLIEHRSFIVLLRGIQSDILVKGLQNELSKVGFETTYNRQFIKNGNYFSIWHHSSSSQSQLNNTELLGPLNASTAKTLATHQQTVNTLLRWGPPKKGMHQNLRKTSKNSATVADHISVTPLHDLLSSINNNQI